MLSFLILNNKIMRVAAVFFSIVTVLMSIITIQNLAKTNVKIIFWKISAYPLGLVIVFSVIIGFVFGIIFFWPQVQNIKSENKKLLKTLHRLKIRGDHENRPDEDDPEGIEMDADENEKSFFKD